MVIGVIDRDQRATKRRRLINKLRETVEAGHSEAGVSSVKIDSGFLKKCE